MFADLISGSNIIELIREETSEAGDSHTAVLRVLDKKRWDKLMVEILTLQHDSEEFGASVRKEYYVEEDGDRVVPTFCWVLLVWGDLDAAVEELGDSLKKRGGPPPPPPSVSVASPAAAAAQRQLLQKKIDYDEDGNKRIRVKAPLPHRAQARNAGSRDKKGKGAVAQKMGMGESGAPAREEA